MNGVLLLDAEWRPVRVETWQRAIVSFFLGKVEVVHYSRDKTISCVERTYPMPSVVRSLRKIKRSRTGKTRVKFSRLNVYVRDNFTCQYDGIQYKTEDLTFDHVVPRSLGGKTTWENIVTSCVSCNTEKADHMLEDVMVHRVPELKFCSGRNCKHCKKWKEMLASSDELTRVMAEDWAPRALTLLNKPRRPNYLPEAVVARLGQNVPEDWKPYWFYDLGESK